MDGKESSDETIELTMRLRAKVDGGRRGAAAVWSGVRAEMGDDEAPSARAFLANIICASRSGRDYFYR